MTKDNLGEATGVEMDSDLVTKLTSQGTASGGIPSRVPHHQRNISNVSISTVLTTGHQSSNSDESENESVTALANAPNEPELQGYLSKWTNYLHGWQPRFIVLKNGTLSYYKSEDESGFGCRGSISLQKAKIKAHEFDELRFDVSISNCVWYLRAETKEDRYNWIEVLQSYKSDVTDPALRRHGSSVSLQSHTLSTTSASSLKRSQRNLKEKLSEIETFRDILYRQIDSLQRYFDACNESGQKDGQSPLNTTDLSSIDFKGEAITFRATTAGVLTTLQHCLEVINHRDESWRRKLEREVDRRKRVEELCTQLKDRMSKMRMASWPGPDFEEGPHSTLPEDEFFDAVEVGLDKIEEDAQMRARLKLQQQQQSQLEEQQVESQTTPTLLTTLLSTKSTSQQQQQIGSKVDEQAGTEGAADEDQQQLERFGSGESVKTHWLGAEIDRVCAEQLSYARQGVGEGGNGWQLFADEGEMKMYRREEEVNGMVIDPLKACHVVKGVSAREMCHYFFSPEFRNDWETTLEEMQILEKISPDAMVFLQTHKRVWPATQRDALFWSHMRQITDKADEGAHDTWVVCNNSVDHQSFPPANTGNCIRIFLTVIMVCQTFVDKRAESSGKITRDDLTCRITYCSVVNPGGWAPAGALRAIYKREYPKFLKRFTKYVIDQCKKKPIMF